MREIAGPGAVGGQFVDYDALLNPNGTVYTADHGNDTQNELLGIQNEFSIAESAGTSEYVLSAIKGIAIGYGKEIGEMYYLDSLKTPVAFDKDAPSTFFPGKCLDNIAIYEDLAVANWPLLVPHLRAKGLTYNEGITGTKSTFDVTNWAIVTNVATLTFANTTAEIAILTALLEDNLVHGSYTNWRSITLAGAIGDIAAGEYEITNVDTSLRQITFAFTAGDNSGAGAFTSNFYTNRVPGSTTTARLYEATGRTLTSANDGEGINGLRVRDRGQGNITLGGYSPSIAGNSRYGNQTGMGSVSLSLDIDNAVPPAATTEAPKNSQPVDDGVNGTPRTGLTTHGPESVGHLYIHARSYVA